MTQTKWPPANPERFTSPFVQANGTASPWLLLASIILATFAALKQYQERTVQTVRLAPNETQSFCHRAVQPDGSVFTQISIQMEVFNISEKSIWLPALKLLRPRSHASVLTKMVMLQEQSSAYYGPYELPPGTKTRGSVDLMIQEDLMGQIDPPPLKWSDLRYVFDIQEDCNGKEAIQA